MTGCLRSVEVEELDRGVEPFQRYDTNHTGKDVSQDLSRRTVLPSCQYPEWIKQKEDRQRSQTVVKEYKTG